MNQWHRNWRFSTHRSRCNSNFTIFYLHPDWPLQEINIQLWGIRALSQVKQSARGDQYIELEVCIEKLNSHVAKIAMNLCGHDLLQPWKTQMSNSPISQTIHKNSSEKNIKNNQTLHIVHTQGTKTVSILRVPTTLTLKHLTNLPDSNNGIWYLKKLQTLEQLI